MAQWRKYKRVLGWVSAIFAYIVRFYPAKIFSSSLTDHVKGSALRSVVAVDVPLRHRHQQLSVVGVGSRHRGSHADTLETDHEEQEGRGS